MQSHRTCLVVLLGVLLGFPHIPLRADEAVGVPRRPKAADTIPPKVRSFDLHDVRLLPGPFRHAQQLDVKYLLQLEPDRLLAWFRKEAGLQPKGKVYGGWESLEIAGQGLGHYLSACALMYAATGDERFRQRIDYIVGEIAEVQKANGNGYAAAIPKGKILFGEIKKRDGEMIGWAPWYVIHKLLAGLRDSYLLAGSERAKEAMLRLADWTESTVADLDDRQMERMLENEHGGMNEALADAYALSGEKKYLALAKRFSHKAVLDPLSRNEDRLAGLHANTQIPKMTGAARIYELTGESYYRDVAKNFWSIVLNSHTYVIGGNSDNEGFGPAGKLSLGPRTTETCNTYNMLKLTRHLYAWTAETWCMDYYEAALINHILCSQNPETGMVCYYLPLKSGAAKSARESFGYSTPFDSFWCCVDTGMENHARYGESIYGRDDKGLYVNLFIASELDWKEKGVKIRQETAFPESDSTKLVVSCGKPVPFRMRIRWPRWARSGVEMTLNGKKLPVGEQRDRYLAVDRTWNDGDTLEARFPMSFSLEPLPGDPRRVAILYGPVVLAGVLGKEAPSADEIPVLIAKGKPVDEWLKQTAPGKLEFRTQGVGRPRDITLVPLYKIVDDHYVVYWELYTPEQWEEKQAEERAERQRRKELDARTIDSFIPGNTENERAHGLKGEKTESGAFGDTHWRHALDGGWFAFHLKTLPDAPVELLVTYWGSDGAGRDFDIMVEGEKIGSESLRGEKPDKFLDRVYAVPERLTKGKSEIEVKFQARPGNVAGGIFGAQTLKSQP